MPNPWDDESDEEDTQAGSDNPNFKQLRDYAKKLEKQLTKAGKDLETLQAFKAEVEASQRQATVAQVFGEVGLSEKHAALFARLNPEGDVTVEAVRAFATEFELPVKAAGEVPAPDTTPIVESGQIVDLQSGEVTKPDVPAGFAPVQTAGTPNAGVITSPDEAMKLYTSNRDEYLRLREAGRIQLDKLPGSPA